ncbi:tail fiber domain-containing protein [Winogradskyella pulchriflava]|uniref:Tail fiber domain-containing protein n=1 Tax=Winogradskyella pulchriflava TaxID=1110688 RepID=A0ABV6Q9W6_9FLAO
MKTKLFTLALLLVGLLGHAQKAINYKAIIKDDLGNVLANQSITIEFSILDGPEIEFTDEVYAETHTTNTDANGVVIVNIGEGVPLSGYEDGYEQLDWRTTSFFGSRFLKVQIDSGSGLIDMGTTEFKAVPYALYAEQSNNTGLEVIDEGNGQGWRLINRPEDFYGPIADGAVDLSYSWAPSITRGATGNYAIAVGLNTTASGQGSFASGVGTIASQAQATAMGAGSVASGHTSVALGQGTKAEAPNSTAIGIYNIGGGDPLLAASTDPLFEIGNGYYVDGTNDVRTNALTVLRNGTITAPSFDMAEITDNKALITKEYADANYSGGGSGTNPTGLEALDEGNGIGWRLVGVDDNNYGNIGNEAIDLSINNITSTVYGATGNRSVALGFSTEASGAYAMATGYNTEASGETSTAMGLETEASGDNSTAFGKGTNAIGENSMAAGELSFATGKNATAMGNGITASALFSTAIGGFNIGGGDPLTWVGTDPVFEIGNGTDFGNKSNALTVLKNGTITAPSLDMAEITDPKALITKEFADANYSGGGSGTPPTGLEAIDEGNGVGWRLVGSDPNNYGNIGSKSVDLSFSGTPSTIYGPTGAVAIAAGTGTTASGDASVAFGAGSTASGHFSLSSGYYTTASGNSSTALGSNTIADDSYSTVVGQYNNETELSNIAFQVGNGTSSGSKSNALNVTMNGIITAPSLDINEITDSKTLITKEYADNNLSASGLEAIDEGNGIGWRLKGSNPANFGNVGLNAVDLSISDYPSSTYGATGSYATAFGGLSTASGFSSTAIGVGATASATGSIALGDNTHASANFAIGFGRQSIASGEDAIALGYSAEASGLGAIAIGNSYANGSNSLSFGNFSVTNGRNSVAMGSGLIVNAYNSMSIGNLNVGGGNPDSWIATDPLFEIGNGINSSNRSNALTILKNGTITAPSFDIAEITDPRALITKEYLEANSSSATGLEAIDEGNGIGWRLIDRDPNNYGDIGANAVDLSISTASGNFGAIGGGSFATGRGTMATGSYSTSMGFSTEATGGYATALGSQSEATGAVSTAFGFSSLASGNQSTASGNNTEASGDSSVAIGEQTEASGFASTALGNITVASGFSATAMGFETLADDQFSTVVGRLNDYTTSTSTLFQVGNGTTGGGRSNAFTVFQSGNALLAGTLTQSSDKRLKKDIEDLSYGLNEILALSPKAYNWKNREQDYKSMGLIAQDVQSVIKEIVHTAEDKDKTLSVSYTELIPVLIKAMQEQQVIIDQQAQTIQNQETANADQALLLQTLLDRVEALEKHSKASEVKLAKN